MEQTKFTFSAAIPLLICSAIALIAIANGGSIFYLGLVFLGLIITLIISGNQNAQLRQENLNKMENDLNNLSDFHSVKTIKAYGNAYIFSVDEEKEKIVFIDNLHNQTLLSFDDILGCEIDIDGETVFKKSTMRTIGGTLVGGVLLGGAGAIVGGLSGNSNQKTKIRKLTLIVKTKNIATPNISFECFDAWEAYARTKNDVDPNDPLYKQALQSANEVKDILAIIIDRVDSRNK